MLSIRTRVGHGSDQVRLVVTRLDGHLIGSPTQSYLWSIGRGAGASRWDFEDFAEDALTEGLETAAAGIEQYAKEIEARHVSTYDNADDAAYDRAVWLDGPHGDRYHDSGPVI